MRKDEFRKKLEGKGVGPRGVTNRIYWCNKIEEDYNVDLDNICKSKSQMQRLAEEIETNTIYKKGEKSNMVISMFKYADFLCSVVNYKK